MLISVVDLMKFGTARERFDKVPKACHNIIMRNHAFIPGIAIAFSFPFLLFLSSKLERKDVAMIKDRERQCVCVPNIVNSPVNER